MSTVNDELPVIVAGDKAVVNVQLTENNDTFVIAPATVIEARVIDLNRKTKITNTTEVTETPTRSNWATSFIVVELTPELTAPITDYIKSSRKGVEEALLEIQIGDNDPQTYFVDVLISSSTID